jgi:hypothetical protein
VLQVSLTICKHICKTTQAHAKAKFCKKANFTKQKKLFFKKSPNPFKKEVVWNFFADSSYKNDHKR